MSTTVIGLGCLVIGLVLGVAVAVALLCLGAGEAVAGALW